jgi:hypothetical protein
VYREAALLAYYFHWQRKEIFLLSGRERRVWLERISHIHGMQKKAREEEAWQQIERLLEVRAQGGGL